MRLIDAVSKADVLETYVDLYDAFDNNKAICKELDKIYDRLNTLPPAQPERKKGKWVPLICTSDGKHHEWCGYQCSICGERTLRLMRHNFCPNCGADMREW